MSIDNYKNTCYYKCIKNLGKEESRLNKRKLTNILKAGGFRKTRNGKGSHEVWSNGERNVTVPQPSGSDYKKGLVHKILKDAGLK